MSFLEEFVDRTRSTYTYTFESTCGNDDIGKDKLGAFDFDIPPFAFPEHNSSKRAIFTLHSFYIGHQTATERASNSTTNDIDGFYVLLNGIGFSANNYTETKACGSLCNAFSVFNSLAQTDLTNSNNYYRISGGEYKGPPLLCSNPTGTHVVVDVYKMIDGERVPQNTNLCSVIHFSIQILPDEIN